LLGALRGAPRALDLVQVRLVDLALVCVVRRQRLDEDQEEEVEPVRVHHDEHGEQQDPAVPERHALAPRVPPRLAGELVRAQPVRVRDDRLDQPRQVPQPAHEPPADHNDEEHLAQVVGLRPLRVRVVEQLGDVDRDVREVVQPHHHKADAVALRNVRKQNKNAGHDVVRKHDVIVLAAHAEEAVRETGESVPSELKHVREHEQRRGRLVDGARLPDAREVREKALFVDRRERKRRRYDVQKKLPPLVAEFVEAPFVVERAHIDPVCEDVLVEPEREALERGVNGERAEIDNEHAAAECSEGDRICTAEGDERVGKVRKEDGRQAEVQRRPFADLAQNRFDWGKDDRHHQPAAPGGAPKL
jgi:hypothetical protein